MRDDENLEFPESTPIDTGNLTSLLYMDMSLPTVMDLTIGQKLFFRKTSISLNLFRAVFDCVLVKNEASVIMYDVLWHMNTEYISTDMKDFQNLLTLII